MSRFRDHYDGAGALSRVDPSVAEDQVGRGLQDGDIRDDQIPTRLSAVSSVKLSPSQTTMDLETVVGIALDMLHRGGGTGEYIGAIASSDGAIMDGHHRWAASILARGPRASVKVYESDLSGERLLKVLNIVSKGEFGVGGGNTGSGSIKDLTPPKVEALLRKFLVEGRSSKHFSPTPELVADILAKNFGSVEEGVKVMSDRAQLIPKNVPSWAPKRQDMPVINVNQAPAAAKMLSQGVVDWSPPYSDAARVAARYRVRQAARQAAAGLYSPGSRTAAAREINADTLTAFGEAFWLPAMTGTRAMRRQAGLGGLRAMAKRLKQLGKLFTKAPRLWEDFKRLVGVKSMTELPGALKDLAKRGYNALRKIVGKAFDTFPLKMFLIKGTSLNDYLSKVTNAVPGLDQALARVKGKADVIGNWLRKHAPAVSTVVIVAIFLFIWMNVLEFEWNLSDLTKALIGQISLGDLLASLPGSALGYLMNGLGFSTFALLPAALVGRMLWLMHKGYVQWNGRWFDLDEDALRRDGYEVTSFA